MIFSQHGRNVLSLRLRENRVPCVVICGSYVTHSGPSAGCQCQQHGYRPIRSRCITDGGAGSSCAGLHEDRRASCTARQVTARIGETRFTGTSQCRLLLFLAVTLYSLCVLLQNHKLKYAPPTNLPSAEHPLPALDPRQPVGPLTGDERRRGPARSEPPG